MPNSNTSETFKENTQRHQLHGRCWKAKEPKAIVCIIHGFGEHSGRYEHVGAYFSSNSVSCYAADLPGHGLSQGNRGDVRSLQDYMLAVDLLYQKALAENPDIPVYLYGHSMGGSLVLRYLLLTKLPPKGAVVTSPWLKLSIDPPSWVTVLGRMALVLGFNPARGAQIDPSFLSRDPKVAEEYQADKLVLGKMTPRTFFAAHDNANYLLHKEYDLPCPVLLAHGVADPITDAKASEKLSKKCKETVDLKLWEGLKHETHNEINKYEVLDFYTKWILDKS